ncbi:hypothetical protein [Bacteroides timonensis]|uniref:hypothetical protein n=1 Tax=Bacteroides timonensis TaxID=1470345 RepID=UPI001427B83C|nr:hypothetical protein [Bacteroides timonensis]
MKNKIEELSLLEMVNINGGSTLTYWINWFVGKAFTTPAVANNNGMNPVHLYN